MDPAIASIITAVIAVLGGGIGQHFLTSWREARRGRKDEAQRIANRADRLAAKVRRYQGWGYLWREHAYAVRGIAINSGAKMADLPATPPQEPTEEEA